MKNQCYVRVIQYEVPPNTNVARLKLLAPVSKPLAVYEGRLLADISVRAPISIQGSYRDGHPFTEKCTTGPVTRMEAGFVLTADSMYQILRIPGPAPVPAVAKPIAKTPERTMVPRDEYFALKADLFAKMEVLAPELSLIRAVFKLHSNQFARVRGDMPSGTIEPLTAGDLNSDFTTLADALLFRYSVPAKRDRRERDLWIAGHRVAAAIIYAVDLESAFLEARGLLAMFTACEARLSRMLHAWDYFATLLPEAATDGAY
jgi:hypothetical protein